MPSERPHGSRPTRREVLGLGTAVAAAWAARKPSRAARARPMRRPNILAIVTDDQGAQMGGVGTKGLATPHMDALAARGVLFQHHYCPFPSCSPARASIFTGLYPHAHGMTANVHEFFGPAPPKRWLARTAPRNRLYKLRPGIPTLIELLARAGYRTGITSKLHVVPHERLPFDGWVRGNRGTDVLEFVRGCGKRPFVLMQNIRSPHRPFRQFISRAKRKLVDPCKVRVPDYLPDTELMRRDWAEYLTTIEITDARVGETLKALRQSGRSDDTLVIFTGDNGPAFHRAKYSEYDFGLRTPLIVAGPGVKAGVRSKALASMTDLMPTILDYAGVELPKPVHGLSLRPVLQGRPGAKGHDLIVGEVHFGKGPKSYQGRGACDGRLLYIRRHNPSHPHPMPADNVAVKPWGNHSYQATIEAKDQFPRPYELLKRWQGTPSAEELFDVAADPWCMHDLTARANCSKDLARMRTALDCWIRQTNDTDMQAAAANS